jgi:hypothetical protein
MQSEQVGFIFKTRHRNCRTATATNLRMVASPKFRFQSELHHADREDELAKLLEDKEKFSSEEEGEKT